MNPFIQNKTTAPLLIALALLGFPLSPTAQAVVPAPDGGYPGRNTAEGQKALFSLTTGTDNTAVGYLSLERLTTGGLNTGVGAWALTLNTADNNTACGGAALLFNGIGPNNTAVGTAALLFNTIGEGNTATGAFALYNNIEGDFNTANGEFALGSNAIGERNTAIGDSALFFNTEGNRNTAVGNPALLHNITGDDNTAIGSFALRNNTDGDQNTAVGAQALSSNTTGRNNIAIGVDALFNNTQGNDNIAIGSFSLSDVTGNRNIALGFDAGAGITTASNVICIGDNLDGANVSNSCYIGGIWSQPGGSQAVYINSDGKLGQMVSSRRFKDEVKSMNEASKIIYGLKPVSFRFKPEIEPTRPLSFGLIAEDVEKISPDLVTRDSDGKVNSVRYEAVNAMLLNEFLQEHRKNEEQGATIAQQQKEIDALNAELKEQASQIQRVCAQLELSKPAQQTVKNTD